MNVNVQVGRGNRDGNHPQLGGHGGRRPPIEGEDDRGKPKPEGPGKTPKPEGGGREPSPPPGRTESSSTQTE